MVTLFKATIAKLNSWLYFDDFDNQNNDSAPVLLWKIHSLKRLLKQLVFKGLKYMILKIKAMIPLAVQLESIWKFLTDEQVHVLRN